MRAYHLVNHLLISLACAALLTACASPAPTVAAKPAISVASAMADADAAFKLGQHEKAMQILKAASGAFPADKTPWLRMAQFRFDSNHYGEAILNALEALERDPDDMLANSIAAVSGLRVASKALGELTQKNNLAGNVRTEAQDLAKLMRASLGEDVLVPTSVKARPAPPKRPPAAAAKPAAGSGDPFNAHR